MLWYCSGSYWQYRPLSVNLRNITIIGGALSIGIDFSLQTIVSNFVCGLILLFERPIKDGDVIQMGEQQLLFVTFEACSLDFEL